MTIEPTTLSIHLQAFVPLEMQELLRQGGPTDWHVEEAQRRMATLREPEASEALYFPIKGQTQHTMSVLVECLAVLAFMPGGIRAFGCHFEAPASILCAWCGKPTDPLQTRPVAVHDDEAHPEHITGTEKVCSECLEETLTAMSFEICFEVRI